MPLIRRVILLNDLLKYDLSPILGLILTKYSSYFLIKITHLLRDNVNIQNREEHFCLTCVIFSIIFFLKESLIFSLMQVRLQTR